MSKGLEWTINGLYFCLVLVHLTGTAIHEIPDEKKTQRSLSAACHFHIRAPCCSQEQKHYVADTYVATFWTSVG